MGVVVVGTGAPDLAVAGGGGHGGRCGGHWCPEPGGRSRLGAWGPVWWALVLRTWRVGQGPSWRLAGGFRSRRERRARSTVSLTEVAAVRSEEHTSELPSLMRTSYAVFCLQKNTPTHTKHTP